MLNFAPRAHWRQQTQPYALKQVKEPVRHMRLRRASLRPEAVATTSATGATKLQPKQVFRNLSPAVLYEKVRFNIHATDLAMINVPLCHKNSREGRGHSAACTALIRCHLRWPAPLTQALQLEPDSHITSTGALATRSGAKTGRSPNDKYVVTGDAAFEEGVWRGVGSPNHYMRDRQVLTIASIQLTILHGLLTQYRQLW